MGVCPTCGASVDEDSNYCPLDGTPLRESAKAWRDPLIGTTVSSRYRVISRLGMGGMSIVYQAHHLALHIDVALKVLRSGLNGDPRSVARFAREARATGRIDHPNVVQVFDFACAEQGFYYLVTEYIPGTSLDAELSRGRLHISRLLHILAQIGAGVGRAHQLGIVHRDLKPDNVMLVQRGSDRDHVKILDFGLARALQPDAQMPALTRAGEIFGTPEYMAPEQWEGGQHDHRVDIYAFGAIAYELLTGEPPFTAEVATQLMLKHVNEVPVRPRERAPDAEISPALEGLVMRCLEKDPGARYGSIDELLRDLGRAWESVPRRNTMTTYSKTFAAPPPPRPDSVPDPTIYQSSDINIVWDGPQLVEEIQRLHALRGKRLRELADALWGANVPAEVDALYQSIATLESPIEREGQELAVLRARLEELERTGREREAALRVKMIDASFAVSASHDQLPFLETEPQIVLPEAMFDEDYDDGPTRPLVSTPEAMLRRAEQKLGVHLTRWSHERAELESRLVRRLGGVQRLEMELAPLYEKLSAFVQRDAARRRELRPLLVAFGQIDGALASFQALLAMIDIG